MVRGPASNTDNSRDEKCSSNLFQVDSLCGTAVSPVQDDDEYEAHAAFLLESEGFGVLDCGVSRLPVRNDALGDFWIPVHLFVDQPKPTPLMLGMDFLKEQRCVIDYGKDLIQIPNAV